MITKTDIEQAITYLNHSVGLAPGEREACGTLIVALQEQRDAAARLASDVREAYEEEIKAIVASEPNPISTNASQALLVTAEKLEAMAEG